MGDTTLTLQIEGEDPWKELHVQGSLGEARVLAPQLVVLLGRAHDRGTRHGASWRGLSLEGLLGRQLGVEEALGVLLDLRGMAGGLLSLRHRIRCGHALKAWLVVLGEMGRHGGSVRIGRRVELHAEGQQG